MNAIASITLNSIIDNLSDSGLPSGDRETSESSAIGHLKGSSGKYTLSFSEDTEGGRINTEITISGNIIRVQRNGAIISDMLFSEGEAQCSVYSIPPYSFDANIFTRKIRGEISERGGKVEIFYDMEIGGAKKSVKMKLICEIKNGN